MKIGKIGKSDMMLFNQKKGLNKQAFYLSCVTVLHRCRKKAFEKNPLLPSGQSLLVSESPIEQAFPIHQDLISLSTGIGSFKHMLSIRTQQGLARNNLLYHFKNQKSNELIKTSAFLFICFSAFELIFLQPKMKLKKHIFIYADSARK